MLLTIQNFADLFVDACLRDDKSELLFLSLFGRDTSILQFFSAFSLKRNEGGLIEGANAQFVLHDDAMRPHTVVVSDVDRLEKLTGRLPSENLFGPLTHAWLFDPCLTCCDRGKREAWLLDEGTGERDAHKLWRRITELSPVPLLEHWREAIIDGLGERLVRPLAENNAAPLGAIGGYRVHLPTGFEAFVSAAVVRGLLLPSGEAPRAAERIAAMASEFAWNAPSSLDAQAQANGLAAQFDQDPDALFALGKLVMTSGVEALLGRYPLLIERCLSRHRVGDWGDVPADDWQANDRAVKVADRLVSSYPVNPDTPDTEKVWVITEWDRSVTTVLLPSEY